MDKYFFWCSSSRKEKKKKKVYVLWLFSNSWKVIKKTNMYERKKTKKKKWCRTDLGYCPIKLYCDLVLLATNCIAIRRLVGWGNSISRQQLYCDTVGWKVGLAGKLYCNRGSVLQLRCVVGWELYCNTTNCIVTVVQFWLGDKCVAIHLLYCGT